MKYFDKLYSNLPVIAFDCLSVPVAWYFAYLLRYNLHVFSLNITTMSALKALPVLFLMQIVCYYYFKVHRGIWRFSSLNDVSRILRAVGTATVLVIPVFYLTSILQHIPRSVLPLYAIVLVCLLCGARLLLRHYWDNKQGKSEECKRVLIVGVGQAGEALIRDLKRTTAYFPVCIVDDDQKKQGQEVHGVQVLGPISKLEDLIVTHQIDLIFIAIPSASSELMQRIVLYCEGCKVPFRTLPSLQALATGRVEVNALREVKIEDLLGRDQVKLNWDIITSNIQNKRVLVTGGGGSIGSELCRQILTQSPAKLLILDNNEFNLYKIDLKLKTVFPNIEIQLALVSVTDEVAVKQIFNAFKPEIVFHAAAYKHVPLLEDHIRVAVQNNILGTQVVAEASLACKTNKFILISTDKAVNPTNIMGTTKRVAEIYCQNLNEKVDTQFITVRFGNVLGSVGSVVPLFQKQLKNNGPLTVTHPDIQRYFMTIPEACQLILQAMVNGNGGEIFILDMGKPIKINYLAEQMIRLAGKEPGKDIKIKYTGLRPGEKLYEELFHESEELLQTEHEKIFKAKFRQIDWNELMKAMDMLHNACNANLKEELLLLLKNLVPESSVKITSEQIDSLSKCLETQ